MNGEIYVIGGDGIDGPLASVERFNTVTHAWSASAPLPQPLLNLGAATVGGTIHVLFENSHYAFSEQMDKWNVAPPMRSPRHAFGTAVIVTTLFVVGGCNQVPQDTGVTEILNIAGRPDS